MSCSFSGAHASLGALVLMLAGCPRPRPPVLTAAMVKASEMPDERAALLKYSDDEINKDGIAGAESSLVALEKAIGQHAVIVMVRDYDMLWRAARACAWLAEEFTDKKTRGQYAYRGVQYAKTAAALEPRRVEGHYYLGINTDLLATTKTLTAYDMVPQVRDEAKAAAKADENFDHGGPLRLLGRVYAEAPSWPASIGDNAEGQKYLSLAVEVAPDYPENHLLYGHALASDGKNREARREYQQVLDAPESPGYEHRLDRWKREASIAMQKLPP